jgi:hypothetical protein
LFRLCSGRVRRSARMSVRALRADVTRRNSFKSQPRTGECGK